MRATSVALGHAARNAHAARDRAMTTITSGDGGDHDHRVATPIGLAALAGMGFSGVDLEPLKRELRARLQAHPDDAAALMDLSTLLQLTGDRASGLAHQAEALRHQQLYLRPPATRSHAGMLVLAFVAPGDLMANTPVEFLLEESEATLDLYYVVPGRPVSQLLPDHDVAFVAIGASDENLPILQQLARSPAEKPRYS